MTLSPDVSLDLLRLDAAQVTREITTAVESGVVRGMRKRGLVVGLSGGVDSSVCAALCARALGPRRVVGLLMVFAASSISEYLRLDASDRIVNVLPFAFDYGLYQLLMFHDIRSLSMNAGVAPR